MLELGHGVRVKTAKVFRAIAVTAVLSLVLTACTGGKAEEEPAPTDAPTAAIAQTGGPQHLQDIWMLHDITGVNAEGKSVSLIDDVVADLTNSAGDAVPMMDGLNFSPLPDLVGTMAAPDGTIRTDISVIFGLFGIPADTDAEGAGSQTLGFVTSAPESGQNVAAGDELVFDIRQFAALEGHESILLDYVFSQAKPADPAAEEGLDPIGVLAARFAAGTVSATGVDVDGKMEVAMWSGVAGNPTSPAAAAVRDAAPQSETTDAASAAKPSTQGTVSQAVHRSASESVVQAGLFSDFMGFPVKGSFFGAGGVAITIFCVVAGGFIAGPAGVVVGAVFCTAIGAALAINDVFTAIEDNTPGAPPIPGVPASSSGDPHLTTFDGARHDLQTVGEFDMAVMDDLRLQLRTAPRGTSRRVSVNTAAALDVIGDTVVVDGEVGGLADVTINGEAVTLKPGVPVDLTNGGIVRIVGSTVVVEWPDGRAVTLVQYGSSMDATVIFPEDGTFDVTGLLGNFDGNPDNDFVTRDGTAVDDLTREAFYAEIASSWRVTEADNLFGQPLTHDLTYPDLSNTTEPDNLAWATAICQAAGLTDSYLADCILDVSQTGDVGFAARAAANQALHHPQAFFNFNRMAGAAQNEVVFENASLTDHPGQLDNAGHALAQIRHEADGEKLHALALPDLDEAWTAPMLSTQCGVAVNDGSHVVAPHQDDDGVFFQIIDAATGKVQRQARTEGIIHDCNAMTATAKQVLVAPGRTDGDIIGFDLNTGEVLHEQTVTGLVAGPVQSHDGTVWVITEDNERLEAQEIDPETGKLTGKIRIPGTGLASNEVASIAPTQEGFIVSVKNEDAGALVRVAPGDVRWTTTFPVEFDGRKHAVPGRISTDEDSVAGYSTSSFVTVFDARTGKLRFSIEPTSFNNNGGHIAHHNGNIVVGTFGGKNWVEAYSPRTQELVWDAQDQSNNEAGDVKRIGSLGEHGVMVQASLAHGTENWTTIQFIQPKE